MSKTVSLWILMAALFLHACVPNPGDPTDPEPPSANPAAQPSETPLPAPRPDPHHYPRVDGSSSTYPLQMTIACRLFEVPCLWLEGDLFSATRRVAPDPTYQGSQDLVERLYALQHSGTHGAYMNLIAGETDFILVARSPSEDETRAAQRANLELEVVPVALDAFVFLLHAQNPIKDLDVEQVRAIYTGDFTRWSQLGGTDEVIHTYQRNRNSGSQELMQALVMRGATMVDSPDMILESMMGPFNAISQDPLGIGYSVYYYATAIFPHEQVKMIAVDSVAPQAQTISDRRYPLTTEVYAVIRAEEKAQSAARGLLAWLLSEQGQQAVADSGYVPLHP